MDQTKTSSKMKIRQRLEREREVQTKALNGRKKRLRREK